MRLLLAIVIPIVFGYSIDVARAAGPAPTHPVLGSWTFVLPGTSCSEIYTFHADGTMFVTSGAEVSESTYEIAARPSSKGFYKWVDRITKDNGKKDCSGEETKVGASATNYIRFLPSGDELIVCQEESLDACFGPLERVEGMNT